MAEVDWTFCYRHFQPLKNHIRAYSVLSIDTKLPDYERKKLAYVDESLKTMAIRVQLLCPVICFLPILLSSGSSRRAIVTKLVVSAGLAMGLPMVYRETQNIGIWLAMPTAISMVLSDAASGNRSSREMAELLEVLRQQDVETAKAAK